MKKLIIGMFVAALTSAGLVVATGGSASADCQPGPYVGCLNTKTKVRGPDTVDQHKKARICASVKAKSSNATPVGNIVFKVIRSKTGVRFFKTVVPYNGGDVCVKTHKLHKLGGYNVKAKYKPTKGSVFNGSQNSTGFDVVPR